MYTVLISYEARNHIIMITNTYNNSIERFDKLNFLEWYCKRSSTHTHIPHLTILTPRNYNTTPSTQHTTRHTTTPHGKPLHKQHEYRASVPQVTHALYFYQHCILSLSLRYYGHSISGVGKEVSSLATDMASLAWLCNRHAIG